MRHIAIIGSGPAGFYTAEAAQKLFGDAVTIDIIDRMPVPYGLIRTGVAPDHQSIKAVHKRYAKVAESDNVHFIGNVMVGKDVTIAELQSLYDAVILATGAPRDRMPDIPGDDLPGVYGSAAFVGWYNGHPDFAALDPVGDARSVAIIGNGNVALDVARILAKSPQEFVGSDIVDHALVSLAASQVTHITILGRRGPHQIAMTPKELGELAHLDRARPIVAPGDLPEIAADVLLEPGIRKSVTHLREFAGGGDNAKPVTIDFDFYAMPVAITGDGKVEELLLERTMLDADLRSHGTGETYSIACDRVISCIGYTTPAIDGVPYEHGRGRFANSSGRILPGLYCVGWAQHGPSGTIGTNKPDGFAIIDHIAGDMADTSHKPGSAALAALLTERGVRPVSFADWKRIDAAEVARARNGSPREKFTNVADMLAAIR